MKNRSHKVSNGCLPGLPQLLRAISFLFALAGSAQTLSQSRYYCAIENLDTASVVRRGLTSSNGMPSNGLILSPNTDFREWLFQAESGLVGFTDSHTPTAGRSFVIPPITLHPPRSPDTDGDGLSDDADKAIVASSC